MTDTPIAFFVYNRPLQTQQVFEAIKVIAPRRLCVIADGPKNTADSTRCEMARKVTEAVDWPCEVNRVYSDANLGCKRRVSSGLAAVFGLYDRAIILEDDCVPSASFYEFASELLKKYENDESITTICGSSFIPLEGPFSYAFSRFSLIWGWATWRRAWRYYDLEMRAWPHLRKTTWLSKSLSSSTAAVLMKRAFDSAAEGCDTWDAQWLFSSLVRNGHCIIPARNLITNIGCGENATHTTSDGKHLAGRAREPLAFPLNAPAEIAFDEVLDRKLLKLIWGCTPVAAFKVLAAPLLSQIRKAYGLVTAIR